MVASPNDFIDVVACARGLLMTGTGGHVFRLEPRGESPAWYCDLDDGTPTGENDPASFVRWVCPALRVVRSPTASVTVDQGHATVWQNGRPADLGTLPGGSWSETHAMNRAGLAVGAASADGGFTSSRHPSCSKPAT